MKTCHKTLFAALLAAAAVAPAFADKGGHGHGGGHDDRDGGDRIVLVQPHHRHDDRVVIRDRDDFRSCPPGLARKHNGCLPPGQARNRDRDRDHDRDREVAILRDLLR